MAVKTVTIQTVTDDLDDKELEGQPSDHEVIFGWGGRRRRIYLSDAHKEQFAKAVQKYVDASADITNESIGSGRTPRTSAGQKPKSDPQQLQAIREWARANGYTVSDRGRIAAEIQEAYHAAK